ncbi:hemolysin [Fusobacterium sp.]|uniref:hemolysin n=1 Tax=Fusobacterium sp. TaxID=68766 RepID=UPI0034C613C7
MNGEKVKAEDLGFNTDKNKAQEKIKDEEKHLDAEFHTDLIGEDKRNEIKKAGGILEDIGTALTSTDKTKGDLLERYKQASMMRAIGEQVEKNPEYLSILEKNVIRNGKIDDESQVEQVSVMNKLLNEALRAKGYKGADIKMVLTDVTDPKGAYYTDTLTNTVVFDRNKLANANRDEILNALGHEFGHYSKADDIDKSQDIANYTGSLLEKRTKNLVSKEATEETLGAIRNNKNVITGEEGKKLAESIPMDRREYHTIEYFITGGAATHTLSGMRGTITKSLYNSTDLKNDKEVKYTATTLSFGVGNDDLSAAIGIGLYSSDSPEEIQKLSTSVGGSVSILTWSAGVDFLSKETIGKNFLKNLLNIQGVRMYIGKSKKLSDIIVPANVEKHATIMDIGNINIIKNSSILKYWEDESIPSGARLYYKYYYKGEQ